MPPVTLDFSKARPIAPVTLDFSKAQPIGDTSQPTQAAPEGFWHSLGAQLGITPEAAQQKMDEFRAHPIQQLLENASGATPIKTLAEGLSGMAKGSADQVKQAYQAYQAGDTLGARQHAVQAVPIAGPALAKAQGQYESGNGLGAAGTIAGVVAPFAVPAAREASADVEVPSVSAVKSRLYPTAKSIPQQTIAARNLAKALVIDPQGASNFIRAATDEAGTVVDYAQKNNIPINSKVDFANAAKQTADAVQSHFDSAIMEPNARTITSVPANYRGTTVGEGPNATLGAINDRINTINEELNPNYRKGLAAQTNAANVSDGDLIAEKRGLTSRLHDKLAQATGLTPEDIAAVRQQAGKLRTIADESNLSANRDLTSAGRQAAGGTSPSSLGTKTGIADRVWQKVQGGAEIMGNREINDVLGKIRPQPLSLPQTNPPVVTPKVRVPLWKQLEDVEANKQ